MDSNDGIHTIDTGFKRPGFDAAYLIVEAGRGAFIDTGTYHSVPRLLAALAQAGIEREAVDWVILTHVHLDHAGGAGELMRQLPRARLAVHPRGARHMIDPSQLWTGATAVYGEATMRADYGQAVPVPAERVVEAGEGAVLELAGRALLCLDTPGHARHHICIWDARSRSFFTGDTFGLSYRALDTRNGPFALPTTTPVQFDPEALHASIDRLLDYRPLGMHLTHYGRVTDVERMAGDLHRCIDAMVEVAQAHASAADSQAAIAAGLAALYERELAAHGVPDPRAALAAVLREDIELNAQGLVVWLSRRAG
ncbi:MBL fold metallo-hydrolase [Acidihalobacter ferrooxydans]|uniref:MBL fold metallo-hydrolase n=1 Tax=Acidihalobacter ferrooxydans TaxID=1765967 RepID=A0A1P8UGW2_9GAMM|nr:MBL fold metallo-hydrolase [Acidihalobacter ferrooxydans]APZ43075.1 MBL fold metallo-hydrolase [Acidihalobacter ferrooxydans]